jgi:hypothetical protein
LTNYTFRGIILLAVGVLDRSRLRSSLIAGHPASSRERPHEGNWNGNVDDSNNWRWSHWCIVS